MFVESMATCAWNTHPDEVKRDGWREQRVLAVALDDHRLTWPERELVRQLGEKLYGPAASGREFQR